MKNLVLPALAALSIGIGRAQDSSYGIQPDYVPSGESISIRASFNGVPACTSFQSTSQFVELPLSSTKRGSIRLGFQTYRLPPYAPEATGCLPVNGMSWLDRISLPDGVWLVYVHPEVRCDLDHPLCDTAYIHRPLDSIQVGEPVAIQRAFSGASPRVRVSGGFLRTVWPDAGNSPYSVEALSTDGRVRHSFRSPGGEAEAVFPWMGSERGIYILRLKAQGHPARLLSFAVP